MQTEAEMRKDERPDPLTPVELAKLDHPTPYLLIDLDAVGRAYDSLTEAPPDVTIRYAVKCNPDERILRRLHAVGSSFEIASASGLQLLTGLGVRPRT